MKKTIIILMAILLASCSLSLEDTGTASFNITTSTKAISGELLAYDLSTLTWKLTAQKMDTGEKFGACENLTIDPDTYTGEFSTGNWAFSLYGYYNESAVYVGAKNATITNGTNHIAMTLDGTGSIGKIRFSNFTVNTNEKQAKIYFDDDTDGSLTGTYYDSATGLQMFDFETDLSKGQHTVTIELRDVNSVVTRVISFKVNIYAGIVSSIGRENTDTIFDVTITIPDKPVIE